MSSSKKKPQQAPASTTPATPPAPVDGEAAKRRIPKVDPGLATVTASALALIGTIVTVSIRATDGGGSTDSAKSGTISAAATTSSPEASSTSSPATEATGSVGPSVQILSTLSPDDRVLVESTADGILQIADRLPLVVDDDFTTGDYAWPEGDATADGGVTCSWQQQDGRYDTTIHTGDGPSWCSNGLTKTATDFALTVDLALGGTSNSDVGVLFRVSDNGTTYYDLRFNPQTQMLWLAFVAPAGTTPIVAPTFVGEIATTGSNRITVLALQDTLAIFVNDTLVVSITGAEFTLDPGRILVLLQLNEANTDETLSLTHFELRGT